MRSTGGNIVEQFPIRHMLNLEIVITYEVAKTIHELFINRGLTGHTAL